MAMPKKSQPASGTVLDRVYAAYRERFGDEPTQSKVAQLLHCDQTTVGEWGRRALPKGEMATKIAKTLDITLDWLFCGRGPQRPREVIESQFALAVELLTRDWSEDERVRTLQYLVEKDALLRKGAAPTVSDLLKRLKSDSGRFRRPS